MSLVLEERHHAHLRAFCEARPGWHVAAINNLWRDEGEEFGPPGKYPRANPYLTGMKFTLDRIVPRSPARVLDIASPIAQSLGVAAMPGIDLTVLDIRSHDDAERLGLKWVTGDCLDMPFDDKSFDIVVCNWVFCHVGDGRYGDDLRVGADSALLREIARVAKDYAVIGVGPIGAACCNIYNVHRIYSWEWLEQEFKDCGLEILDREELPVEKDVYFGASFVPYREIVRMDGMYGIVSARPT